MILRFEDGRWGVAYCSGEDGRCKFIDEHIFNAASRDADAWVSAERIFWKEKWSLALVLQVGCTLYFDGCRTNQAWILRWD